MSQSAALATLTATYTDSEGEDEVSRIRSFSHSPSATKSANSSLQNSPTAVRVTTKVAKLVSYHDDNIVSDDEEAAPHHEVIVLASNETADNRENDSLTESDGVQLPPEAPGYCSTDLQEKISRLYEKMQNQQLDMNALIQKRKDFRNPSIYEKLLQFCAINELGTNYPPTIYDPLKWDKQSYYEELAKVQKVEMDKREKERKSKVEVVSGTKKQEDDSKKRKSKWDQPGGNSLGSQSIKPAGLIQPSLTSSATGTKGTVISAFGSLPKKPRP